MVCIVPVAVNERSKALKRSVPLSRHTTPRPLADAATAGFVCAAAEGSTCTGATPADSDTSISWMSGIPAVTASVCQATTNLLPAAATRGFEAELAVATVDSAPATPEGETNRVFKSRPLPWSPHATSQLDVVGFHATAGLLFVQAPVDNLTGVLANESVGVTTAAITSEPHGPSSSQVTSAVPVPIATDAER